MATIRRIAGALPLCVLLVLGACVSMEEAPIAKGAVAPGQRTLILVHLAPGPLIAETDSKVETAAKIVPGLGLVVQSAEDDRDLATSKDLQQYLPAWTPEDLVYSALAQRLPASGHPGTFLLPSDVDIATATFRRMNRADNLTDWKRRYWLENPEQPTPRNYSTFLTLDDALIFEVNCGFGVDTDGEGNATPSARSLTKVIRVNSMKVLWRHEDEVTDKTAVKLMYDFKTQPQDLLARWEKLAPALAQQIAASYRENLAASGIVSTTTLTSSSYAAPAVSTAPASVAPSSATVSGTPAPSNLGVFAPVPLSTRTAQALPPGVPIYSASSSTAAAVPSSTGTTVAAPPPSR